MRLFVFLLSAPSLRAVAAAHVEKREIKSCSVDCAEYFDDVVSAMQVNTRLHQGVSKETQWNPVEVADNQGSKEIGPSAWKGVKIVGAGLSRTATESLYEALKMLGYNPSHGERYKSNDPRRVIDLAAASIGNMTGLLNDLAATKTDAVFDSPLQAFADEFVARYDSKVILSLHPGGADGWVDSVQKFTRYWQIFSAYPAPSEWMPANSSTSCVVPVSPTLIIDKPLRESCKKAYEDYNAKIIKHFPSDRLLVYDVASHWDPLAKFLGKGVPTTAGQPVPFPHFDNVADKKESLRKCGFCGKLVNGRLPIASDTQFVPPDMYED